MASSSGARTSGCAGAFIEAAWVAVGCSSYFGTFYKQQRTRGKKANTTIPIVAQRMCRIVWHLLQEKRPYLAAPPTKNSETISPAAPV